LRPTRDPDCRPITPAALAIAAITVGRAIQVNIGLFSLEGLFWLTIGLAACGLGVASPRIRFLEGRGEKTLIVILAIGIFIQFLQFPFTKPAMYLPVAGLDYAPFTAGIVCAALLAILLLSFRSRVRHLAFATIVATHLLLGVWIIRSSPHPDIDVYVFHRGAAEFLLQGLDPYAMTYPDIYGPSGGSALYYGPGMSVAGRLRFGFPYPPLSLLLSLPGHILFDDFRYAHLAAIALAGVLIAFLRPGRVAMLAAVLFLFTPRVFLVVEQGWTEPLAVMLFAATLFCHYHWPRALGVALGLTVAVKQYLVMALISASLLLTRPFAWNKYGRFAATPLLVAFAVTSPFVAWDVHAFARSVVLLQFRQPFRADSLSYPALIAYWWGFYPPAWTAFLALAAAAVFGLPRARPTAQGFAAVTALVFLLFFSFNKQAFCNYYFFVIGLLCCAVACTAIPPGPVSSAHTLPPNPTAPTA
jgi:hypothetical protein